MPVSINHLRSGVASSLAALTALLVLAAAASAAPSIVDGPRGVANPSFRSTIKVINHSPVDLYYDYIQTTMSSMAGPSNTADFGFFKRPTVIKAGYTREFAVVGRGSYSLRYRVVLFGSERQDAPTLTFTGKLVPESNIEDLGVYARDLKAEVMMRNVYTRNSCLRSTVSARMEVEVKAVPKAFEWRTHT